MDAGQRANMKILNELEVAPQVNLGRGDGQAQ